MQYNLGKIIKDDDEFVCIEIQREIYSLSKAELLAHEDIIK